MSRSKGGETTATARHTAGHACGGGGKDWVVSCLDLSAVNLPLLPASSGSKCAHPRRSGGMAGREGLRGWAAAHTATISKGTRELLAARRGGSGAGAPSPTCRRRSCRQAAAAAGSRPCILPPQVQPTSACTLSAPSSCCRSSTCSTGGSHEPLFTAAATAARAAFIVAATAAHAWLTRRTVPLHSTRGRHLGFREELIGVLCALKPWTAAPAGLPFDCRRTK